MNPAAADLLTFCAFLAPDAIPEELITQGAPLLGPAFQAMVNNPFHFNTACKDLLACSLIGRDAHLKTLTMHRLVQFIRRAYLDKEERQLWGKRTIQAVNTVFPPVKFATRPQCKRLLPHALEILKYLDQIFLSKQDQDVLTEIASLRQKIAAYFKAHP